MANPEEIKRIVFDVFDCIVNGNSDEEVGEEVDWVRVCGEIVKAERDSVADVVLTDSAGEKYLIFVDHVKGE